MRAGLFRPTPASHTCLPCGSPPPSPLFSTREYAAVSDPVARQLMAWEKPLPEAGIFLQVCSSPQRLYFLSLHLFCQADLGFPEAILLHDICEFLLSAVRTTTLLFATSLPPGNSLSCCDVFAVHGQSSGTGETPRLDWSQHPGHQRA